MKLSSHTSVPSRPLADACVLPFYIQGKKPVLAHSSKLFDKWLKLPLQLGDFEGKAKELFIVHPPKAKEPRLILLGLGELSEISCESLRKSYAAISKYTPKAHLKKLNLLFPQLKGLDVKEILQGVSEGLLLSHYVFDQLKSKKTSASLKSCVFIGLEKKYVSLLDKSMSVCAGVNLARDLVNENADTMTPQKLASIAKNFQKQFKKVTTTVYDKSKIEEKNLKLLKTVSQGSHIDPALIMVNYKGGTKDQKPTVLLGKGITYDSGGIQLKPRSGSIVHMKCDMGGAAAVLGTLYAAAKLDLPINIIGVIPACENAISDKAYKPGDVYESYLGKTIEILSTDAEGRLVLADALAYAEEHLLPSQMIDLATLTGGVVASLGHEITGLMSNDRKLAKTLLISSKKSGEEVWELPLYQEYKVALKSKIADLKNVASSPGYPAAVVAGLFLEEFVKKTPWAHLDIAGTAYIPDPKDHHPTKATGVGVRLLLAFLDEIIATQGES